MKSTVSRTVTEVFTTADILCEGSSPLVAVQSMTYVHPGEAHTASVRSQTEGGRMRRGRLDGSTLHLYFQHVVSAFTPL